MAESTSISWTDHTLNLWWGCAKVHAGCDHCYAETFAHRYGHALWGSKAPRKASKSAFRDVLKYQRKAAAKGVVRRVFVGSMMDIFEKPFPLIDAQGKELPETTGHLRARFFEEIVPRCPNLLFLLLTKRPGNILKYIPEAWKATPPVNVMYGTSVVNQETADEMIPKLLAVPGRRFLSMEPLLGPVRLDGNQPCPCGGFKGRIGTDSRGNEVEAGACDDCGGSGWMGNQWLSSAAIDWVIVGGESGPGARPMHPKWAQSLRDECQSTGVLFHFKQWGEYLPVPIEEDAKFSGGRVFTHPNGSRMVPRIRFPSPKAFCSGKERPMQPGEGNRVGIMLDQYTMAVKVKKHEAGNLLDKRTWQEVPTIDTA